MTTASVAHSNPKGNEKEKEKDEEEKKKKEKGEEEKGERERERSNELMSSFLQWINEGLYKHHAKKRDKDDHYLDNCSNLEFKQLDFVVAFPKKKDCVVPEYENKIVGTIKGFGIPGGLPWHLTDKVYDSMSSSRTNRKLCSEIHKLSTFLPKYLEFSGFLIKKTESTGQFLNLTNEKTNLTHSKSDMLLVLPNKQAIVCKDCGLFLTAYAEFLSDGLQVPSDGISSETLCMRYASLLWNCEILKPQSGYVSNNKDPQRPRPKKSKFDENVVIKVVVAIFSTTSVVICCDSLLQQGIVALIISSLSLISSQDGWVVIPFEILSNFKKLNLYKYNASCQKKIVLTNETTDTKIHKRPRTKTCRKKNENSTTTLLEELAFEAVSSSQVEPEFSQKNMKKEKKKKIKVGEVDEEEGKKEDEEEEGNKKEVEEDKGKQKEVEEEEGKNKQVVEEEEEKINDVDEEKGKQKEVEEEEQEKNEVEGDDGIKTINAHTFPVHLQPNATVDSIMRSAMGKPFDTFRIMLKQKCLKDFCRNSCFGHFLDLPEKNNARFQMTMVYELLKRRFIFQNPKKKDEPIPEFIVKKNHEDERKEKKKKQDSQLRSRTWCPLLAQDTSKKHKESMCLLWFVHNVLLAKDVNNNISLKWGHHNFELTVKYLLKPLGPKTNNLFGFPWDFMAWAFEVIPHLRYQVVHQWLVPIEKELQMPYLITLGLVETLFDPVVDRVKMELVGARTIKRDTIDNELVVFYEVDGGGIDVGAGVDVGGDIGAGAGQDQWATSCKRCFGFLCEKCKKQDEDFIMYLQTLKKRRKKSFINAIQNLKKKIFRELSIAVGEEVLKFKHVNVYKRMPIAQKNKLIELMRGKELSAQYGMHDFSGEDFRTMTSMKIWHVRYHEYYDSTNRILDLNFYSNFKQRYDKMSEEATTVSRRSFTQLINEFEWNEDMINYVRGIRPYPEGMD
ncbi:hypothetical protein H5410_040143 [Solanum commersonii]|uniref:Uncharacterized protein n=1 Tax=Solanum commersonii TaxID=4109 RepID=A0A9J5XP88_SOLCO|nr:hypothetical protein H5410_040143 [Solanum commersonii]